MTVVQEVANRDINGWLEHRKKEGWVKPNQFGGLDFTSYNGRNKLSVHWSEGDTMGVSERYFNSEGAETQHNHVQIGLYEMLEIIASYPPEYIRAIADAAEKLK